MQMFREFNWENVRSSVKNLGLASYALIAVVFASLISVIIIAILGRQSVSGTDVLPIGHVALSFGVGFSIIVGVGLMALALLARLSRDWSDCQIRTKALAGVRL